MDQNTTDTARCSPPTRCDMKPLVIYHASCTDGFGAAFAAWLKLGDEAEYLPMHYGKSLNVPIVGREVYVLDFSFPRAGMNYLFGNAKRVVWLDHHKTAFEEWCLDSPKNGLYLDHCDRAHITLDVNKSGALLAWEFFHPDTEVPRLIQLIDDRDRWQFKYGSDSRALHAALQLEKPWTFERWAHYTSSITLAQLLQQGASALYVYERQIAEAIKRAERCVIPTSVVDPGGVRRLTASGLAVNSPVHQSEIGNALADASGTYGMVWHYDAESGRANCSLRSIGEYDVSAIAKQFGGGGHRNAAGFNIDMPRLLAWLWGYDHES